MVNSAAVDGVAVAGESLLWGWYVLFEGAGGGKDAWIPVTVSAYDGIARG